jgi:serine/threonine-protein kinase
MPISLGVAIERLRRSLANAYDIDREIGRDGMSVVFLAQYRKHDRVVAIKVLHPEIAACLGSDRFLREIRLAAKLSHPHILPLFDSGEADGVLYYVMPFVDGGSLRERLDREKQLSVEESVRHGSAIASALDYANRQGVIHRDIKPENVLINEGVAMVMDFGVAKAASLAESSTLTQAGMMIGTPAYVSPEQASGEFELDGRSDQYSLACVVYEMLSGERSFQGVSAQAVMARRFTETAKPLRTIRAAVPEGVERAVARAMSVDPADRFPSCTQFAQALAQGSIHTPSDTFVLTPSAAGASHSPDADATESAVDAQIPTALPSSRLRWLGAGGAVLLAIAAAVAWYGHSSPGAPPSAVSAPPAATPVERPSLAVLPLVSLDDSGGNITSPMA